MNSIDILLEKYKPRNAKYIYRDKIFDNRGIDYKNYIPLRFESINRQDIKKIYGIKSWYVLWYLMANAENSKYIKTTIQTIYRETNLSSSIIKRELRHLQEIGIINIFGEINDKTNSIIIVIGYNDKEVYEEFSKSNCNSKGNNGYRAIPKEFIRAIIPSLNYNQWAIFTVLCVRYSWYTLLNEKNDYGEELYNYMITGYAFPTQEEMKYLLGISRETIMYELYGTEYIKNGKEIKKKKQVTRPLIENKYNLITIETGANTNYNNKEKENRIKKENNRYFIDLFERVEYLYNCIYKLEDNRDKKIKNKIKDIGFKNIAMSKDQKILNNQDLINYYYKGIMKEYENNIKTKNKENYIKTNRDYKYTNYLPTGEKGKR